MSEPISVDVGRGKRLRLTDEAFNVAAIIPIHEGNDDGSTFNPSQSIDDIFYGIDFDSTFNPSQSVEDIFYGIDFDFENFPVTYSDFLDPEVTTGTPALNPVTSIASEKNRSKRGLPPTETPKAKRLRPTPSADTPLRRSKRIEERSKARPTPSADTPLRRSNRVLLDESTPLSSSSSKTRALSSAPAAVDSDTPKARQPPSRLRSSTSKTGALSSAPIASKDNQLKRGSPPVDTPRAKRLKQTSHVDTPLRRSERIKKRVGTTESSGSELVTGNRIESPESHPKANVPRNKVFTFGTGDCGELGQGPTAKRITRPRLVKFFEVNGLHIIEVDAGGMHMLALDSEGRVWSWGVNDKGALGRDTHYDDAKFIDPEGDEDESASAEMNPRESNPALVEKLPEGVRVIRTAAGDSCSFFITSDGNLYGCGIFRGSDGDIGFTEKSKQINFPQLITLPAAVTDIAAGDNHVLALLKDGSVYCWGDGESFQLGYRVDEGDREAALTPNVMYQDRNKKAKAVFAGGRHSFVVTEDDTVLACGLNNYGQCGIEVKRPIVKELTVVPGLSGLGITMITAGGYHSMAMTSEGGLIMWGRCDSGQVGDISLVDESYITTRNTLVLDEGLTGPMPTGIGDRPHSLAISPDIRHVNFSFICSGLEHNIAVSEGLAFSWGSGMSCQIGQGSEEDVNTPTRINNTAVKDIEVLRAAACANCSVLLGAPKVRSSPPPS